MSDTITQPTIDRERIVDLIQIARRIPPERLDMEVWADKCGVVACLAGHYASAHPEQFRIERTGLNWSEIVCIADGKVMWFEEWSRHFRISLDDAFYLFDPDGYDGDEDDDDGWKTSKAQVIERLESFARANGIDVPEK